MTWGRSVLGGSESDWDGVERVNPIRNRSSPEFLVIFPERRVSFRVSGLFATLRILRDLGILGSSLRYAVS
jgi:hypothetical protein